MPTAQTSTTPVGIDPDLDQGRSAEAAAARRFIEWLESGIPPEHLFAADVFGDLSLPHWRVQATGLAELLAIRRWGHPAKGQVRVEHLDHTSRGWLLQFEERWTAEGQHWYSRELIHAVIVNGLISEIAIYCTGDWDEATQRRHAAEVQLTRP